MTVGTPGDGVRLSFPSSISARALILFASAFVLSFASTMSASSAAHVVWLKDTAKG